MLRSILTSLAVLMLAGVALAEGAPPAAPKPELYLISPANGAQVKSPFTVRFGLKGLGIAPAGIKFDNTGHHHLLVDTDAGSINFGEPLPLTGKILHFGKGQTETELTLPPGKHTLQLLFGDAQHVPYSPKLASKKITIIVK